MTDRASRAYLCVLTVLLTAAAPPARLGFVNLPQLVASHPLYEVLREYDCELGALRATQKVPGLSDAARQAGSAAISARRESAAAQRHAQPNADPAREQRAIAQLFGFQRGGDRGVNAFGGELARATGASISAYEQAMAQRNARAYAARAQELREKELTLGFNLAQSTAGKRLSLRLKLQELHLTRAARKQLASQLAALGKANEQVVGVMRRADAGVLAAYRAELNREAGAAIAAMSAQLQRNAAANFATRQRVARAAGTQAFASAQLSARAAAFRAGTPSRSDDIRAGFKSAGADLSRQFSNLASTSAASAAQTASQIRALEATRVALYRTIVTEIARDAEAAARQRNLAGVRLAGGSQATGVDLTSAVREELNSARR
ncbi:MAG TPA: hypothetical protein VEW74_02395 [Candidatus Nitrosotalea sp.]|nr:hypothetical protein [Candidatus Nitrosotalea sp.]